MWSSDGAEWASIDMVANSARGELKMEKNK